MVRSSVDRSPVFDYATMGGRKRKERSGEHPPPSWPEALRIDGFSGRSVR